jgi:CheY-like chemotaxis protein
MRTLILVVDDESDVESLFRQYFRRELRRGSYEMDFVLSAQEALARVEGSTDADLILVLSDINMPGMSGLDLLPRLRERRPDVPVYMITAYGDTTTRARAMERGARDFLTKPLDFGALRSLITERLAEVGRDA